MQISDFLMTQLVYFPHTCTTNTCNKAHIIFLFSSYYQDIKMMPAISDQDMTAMMAEESRVSLSGPEVIKLFSYPTQNSLKFQLYRYEGSQNQRKFYAFIVYNSQLFILLINVIENVNNLSVMFSQIEKCLYGKTIMYTFSRILFPRQLLF